MALAITAAEAFGIFYQLSAHFLIFDVQRNLLGAEFNAAIIKVMRP